MSRERAREALQFLIDEVQSADRIADIEDIEEMFGELESLEREIKSLIDDAREYLQAVYDEEEE